MLDFAQHLLLASGQLARSAGSKAQGLGHRQALRSRVAGHNNHRIAKIHRASLPVRQASILHNLQQQIKHIGMGFFDFVQQHHAVGLATNSIRQLTTLIVAHIARWCANQASGGVLFHIFAHIKTQHGSFIAKKLLGQGLSQLGFANTSRTKEEEGTHGTIFILKACPCTAYRLTYGLHSLILSNNTLS